MAVKQIELPSLLSIAWAQTLASISLYFPHQRVLANVLILLVPSVPLIGGLVAIVLGRILVGIMLVVLFSAIAAYAMYRANKNFKYPVLPEAVRSLQFSATQIRAKSLPRYNIFFPPGPKNSIKCAILLIPGAMIDPGAYAQISRQLSDEGVLVVVPNTAPYYLPSTLLGARLADLKWIMDEVTSQHEVKEWAIGGHDMGMIPAMQLVEKLNLSKLVLWGAYDPWNIVNLSSSKINVLVVMPSNDMYWKVLSEAQISKFRSNLPPEAGAASTPNRGSSVYKMLEGGNHSGFAHYGPVKEDGERTMSSQDQQKSCATVTALFLKNPQSFYYGRNA